MFKFEIKDHKIAVDIWMNKNEIFHSFYKEFYNFIKKHGGKKDLLEHNIHNVKEFYEFADWNAGGKDSCYAMGFAFHKYYLSAGDGRTLDDQPETTFIGYCHKNNLFSDFLSFLITFFAWWRNDEGCTCFDPYNHAY